MFKAIQQKEKSMRLHEVIAVCEEAIVAGTRVLITVKHKWRKPKGITENLVRLYPDDDGYSALFDPQYMVWWYGAITPVALAQAHKSFDGVHARKATREDEAAIDGRKRWAERREQEAYRALTNTLTPAQQEGARAAWLAEAGVAKRKVENPAQVQAARGGVRAKQATIHTLEILCANGPVPVNEVIEALVVALHVVGGGRDNRRERAVAALETAEANDWIRIADGVVCLLV